MERGTSLTGQYRCNLCGKSCTCVIELHEHEKVCIETQIMLRRVGLGRSGQSFLLRHQTGQARRGSTDRL
jgi:hypothetical protein